MSNYCKNCYELIEQLDQLKGEKEILKQYNASKQASYESMQREWNQAVNENRELKAEIETLKSFDINLVGVKECEIRQLVQYRKALTEIKPILELYANSKIGEEQPNGTYKIVAKVIGVLGGTCIAYYDPRPAREALQKIREME